MILVVRTVKVPVHYGITKRKLSVLDLLTARTTYGIWLWSQLFKEHKLEGTYADRHQFYDEVKAEAGESRSQAWRDDSVLLRHGCMDVVKLP